MVVIETDPAWWSIVVSYMIVSGFVIGIGLRDGSLATVSSMVARSPFTLHAFAMATLAIVACQMYWLHTQLERWAKPDFRFWYKRPVALTLVVIGAVGTTVGTLGFGVVSTDLSETKHIRFAATSFVAVLFFELGILLVAVEDTPYAKVAKEQPSKPAAQPIAEEYPGEPRYMDTAVIMWILAVVSLVLFGLDEPYFWEYILITALHACALSVTKPLPHRIFYEI